MPLSGGDGWVVVARVGRVGEILGYFFASSGAGGIEAKALASRSDEATFVGVASALGISKRAWKKLGQLTDWNRDQWPVPLFQRRDPLRPERAFVVEYGQDDLGTPIGVRSVSKEQVAGLPEDGLAGRVFAERRLARLFEASRRA